MQTTEDKIITFLKEWLGCDKELNINNSIGEDLYVDGDDGIELLEEYSKRFSVDISGFPFDDYFGPEGGSNPFNFFLNLFKKNPGNLKTLYIRDLVEGVEKKVFTNN